MSNTLLTGIHAVEEALRADRPIERILIARGRSGPRVQELIEACRARGVPVRFEPRQQLTQLAGSERHQGVVALVAARGYIALEELLKAGPREGRAGLLVVLDAVEDPHNLGAILRTAHCAGADGVILPERRAAPLTETVARAAAGAIEHLPVARVTNLGRALEELKQAGYWTIGLDERAPTRFDGVDYRSACALVLGSEGKGLHEQVRKKCDFLVSIPTFGKIASLNVSVAAGIVLYEVVRQRSKD